MSRWPRSFLMLLVLLLVLLILGACGGDQAEPAADTPVPPTDTAVPPTETPIPPTPTPRPPTATPKPAPTPQLMDPSTLALPGGLDTFVLTQFESWDGVGPDGQPTAYQTDLTAEFVREPEALYVRAVSDDPEAAAALQLLGSADGAIELYVIADQMYVPIMGSWMQIPVDTMGTMIQADEVPFNPSGLMDEAFTELGTVAQWLESAVYQDRDSFEGLAVERYAVDESSFNPDSLPSGMVIDDAEGLLYVSVDNGYLVGIEITITGTDLATADDQDQPTLGEGTVIYRFGLSGINEPLEVELPEAALLATQLPEDIALPDDAVPAGVFNMMGFQSFSYFSQSSVEDVAAFYRSAMPELGWTETGAAEEDGAYSLSYEKDDRLLEISIVADAEPGYTGIDIMPSQGS